VLLPGDQPVPLGFGVVGLDVHRRSSAGIAAGYRTGRRSARGGAQDPVAKRIRHSFATEVRARFGLEAAQVLLGHKNADATQLYAASTLAKAKVAARAMG
jgi:integrase